MRTPNTKCCICEKPLYRRPSDMDKARYVACMAHRAEAARQQEPTKAQLAALALGRKPGTNNRTGYRHRDESRRKTSEAHKKWCEENPEQLKARGKKTRGKNHYNWKGGVSKLNTAVRRMTENRKWMDEVKRRDGCCTRCGSTDDLEAHHKASLGDILKDNGIKNTDEARKCEALWDTENGVTLCKRCHYKEHGRRYAD